MKISPAKRNKLIAVVAAIVLVVGLICYFVIGTQLAKLKELQEQYQGNLDKQRHMETAMASSEKMDSDLAAAQEKLSAAEGEMASGDLYSWMYNTIKAFKTGYRVDIPQFSSVETGPNTLIYNFPYKQVKISISGTAFFQDFGKFLADFENHFPHIRMENLILEPTSGAEKESDREKLAFKMDVITLVNANPDADKKQNQ